MKIKLFVIALTLLNVTFSACASPQDPTRLASAGLYLDPDGTQPTKRFNARAVFYCIVTLDQPLPDSTLRASWVAVETNRLAPDAILKIDEIVPTSTTVLFKLQNDGNFWPTGVYKLYLYLDGKEMQEIEFEVYHDYFTE